MLLKDHVSLFCENSVSNNYVKSSEFLLENVCNITWLQNKTKKLFKAWVKSDGSFTQFKDSYTIRRHARLKNNYIKLHKKTI